MRLLGWLRRDEAPDDGEPLDLDQVLADGLRDPAAAREALRLVARERALVRRQQRVVDGRLRRMSTPQIRNMARTGPAIGPVQLAQAMEQMNAAGQDPALAEQEAMLERRMEALDAALARLRARARQPS